MKVVAHAPLRISLAGGGTDLPEFYGREPTRLLAVAIDPGVTVEGDRGAGQYPADRDGEDALVGVFRREAAWVGSVRVRSEVGPGAGLGGSGAVATALAATSAVVRDGAGSKLDRVAIGLEAYRWEREILGRPVGFQDQLASAIGGCVEMRAGPRAGIEARRRPELEDALDELLVDQLALIDTGVRRDAAAPLASLAGAYASGRAQRALAAADDVEEVLVARDGAAFGTLLARHWEGKRVLLPAATSEALDAVVGAALEAGATGCKVVGAGGGGCLLAAGPSGTAAAVHRALAGHGLAPLRPSVNRRGVEVHVQA